MARKTDSIVGGYFSSSPTRFSKNIDESFSKLLSGDETAWAKLLYHVKDDPSQFIGLRELSPFKDQFVIFYDWRGSGDLLPYLMFNGPMINRREDVEKSRLTFIAIPVPQKYTVVPL